MPVAGTDSTYKKVVVMRFEEIKKRSRLLSFALAMSLCFSSVPSAFAVESAERPVEQGNSAPLSAFQDADSEVAEGDEDVVDNSEYSSQRGTPIVESVGDEEDASSQGSSQEGVLYDGKPPESTLAEGTYVIMNSFGKVLDVDGGSCADAANVQTWSSNMTLAQRFKISCGADGFYTIQCVNSGKVLDIMWGDAHPGTNVQQYDSNGTAAQKWALKNNDDGTFTIESALAENIVLDVAHGSSIDGTNIQIWDKNRTEAQRFVFLPDNPAIGPSALIEDGIYCMRSVLANDKSLDISNASLKDGTGAQLWSSNGTFAQMFQFTREKSGFYTIRALHSAKVLDVSRGNLVPGARIQQWTSEAGNSNQLWSLNVNKDETYSLTSVSNGLVLDVRNGGTTNGTATQTYTGNGSKAQKWILEKTDSIVEEGVYSIQSNVGSRRYLDISDGSPSIGASVQTWNWNGSPAQRYRLIAVQGEDTFTVEALCSGLLLTQKGSDVVQSSASTTNPESQQWRVVPSAAGGLAFLNVSSGLALDVSDAGDWDGCNIGVFSGNGTAAQSFVPQKTDVIGEGTYLVRSAVDGRVLDVAGGSRSDGANIQTWTGNGTGAQVWNFRGVGDGCYEIQNARSRKALDVENYGTDPGTNVQQWSSSENKAQRWRIEYAGNGKYRLVSACGNQCLDVSRGGGWDGANVQAWTPNGTDAQLFRLEMTYYVRKDFEDCIASFTTYSTNSFNGTYNMQKALNTFNNCIIWPGQTMSFFGVTGPCGAAQGYLPAGVVGGVGYGGGICQASTTLYGASIRAGLTVVERANHTVPSSYVPIGLDAMVSYGSSDFKVRNDWDFPVKLVISTPDNILHVDILGIQPDWYDWIDAQSWKTGSNTAAAQRVFYKDGNPIRVDGLSSSYYW